MKLGKIVRTAIRWAPVVYPIVKKFLNNKNTASTASSGSRRR